MSILKKWTSCVVSFIASVLAFAMSAVSGMVAVTTLPVVGKETSITKAFKVITDGELLEQAKNLDLEDKFMAMKVFSIILMVVAVLLLVYSIVILLKNLNVIKLESKAFGIVGIVLSVLFIVSALAVLLASNSYAGAMETTMAEVIKLQTAGLGSISVKIGLYQPFMLVTSIVSGVSVSTFEALNFKKQ